VPGDPVIAYVFWHRAGTATAGYEAGLAAFHEALRAHPPAGFVGSSAFRLDDAPWLAGGGQAYEDWYLVADWAALGSLNQGAVSGERSEPHDAVAAQAREGAGAVYAPLHGGEPAAGEVAWVAKPEGMSYPGFHSALGSRAAWQRQMVLGPTPEYVVESGDVPWPGVRVTREQVC
jgi:hypothetical protein